MKKTNPERYQVVIILEDGTWETRVWTDCKGAAVSVAKDTRSRHPDALAVVLNDYSADPVPTFFW